MGALEYHINSPDASQGLNQNQASQWKATTALIYGWVKISWKRSFEANKAILWAKDIIEKAVIWSID